MRTRKGDIELLLTVIQTALGDTIRLEYESETVVDAHDGEYLETASLTKGHCHFIGTHFLQLAELLEQNHGHK